MAGRLRRVVGSDRRTDKYMSAVLMFVSLAHFLAIARSTLFLSPHHCSTTTVTDMRKLFNGSAQFLNLPTWIQAFSICDHEPRAVPCHLVLRAASFLRDYIPTLSRRPDPDSVASWIFEGIGNHMWGDVIAFTFAVMLNTTFVIRMTGRNTHNFYSYAPGVRYLATVPGAENWTMRRLFHTHALPHVTSELVQELRANRSVMLSRFTLPAFCYLQPAIGWRLYHVFGDFAVYFLSNFLIRFPDTLMRTVMDMVAKIPDNISLYGFHMRWNRDGDMFIGTVDKGIARVRGLIGEFARKGWLLALASDSRELVQKFTALAGKGNVIRAPTQHRSLDALLDMILIMYCRRHVLTLRSTFSATIAQRTGRNPLWVCNFLDHLFKYSSSQVVWQTLVYQDTPFFSPNLYLRVQLDTERLMRFHIVHFGA
jgi:hypothetical protein